MINVKPVNNCLLCNEPGQVVRVKGDFILLQCNECKRTWQTLSGFCPSCKKPNGYPQRGLCLNCYNTKKNSGSLTQVRKGA